MPATLGVLLSIPLDAQQSAPILYDEPQTSSSSSSKSSPTLEGWHFTVSPYLWFPGIHGTVGALGHDVSVHASAGDLLSHFRFGLMGAATAQHKRLLLAGDLMWVRLGDTKALPFPNLGAVSADVKVSQVIWTSNVGVRLIDAKKFKADAVAGIRFWDLGQNLTFNPSVLGLNSDNSKNWADPVVPIPILAMMAIGALLPLRNIQPTITAFTIWRVTFGSGRRIGTALITISPWPLQVK
jgi:hypothetical protein